MIILLLTLISLATATAVHVCGREENLALQGSVSQSGTIRSAVLAIDGDVRPAQTEDDRAQCALTKSNNDLFSWWQVNLKEPLFLVSNVEIYTPNTNIIVGVGNTKLQDNEEIHRTPTDISLCKIGIRDEETGKIDASCGLSGQYVTIINQAVYESLSVCEVQIYRKNHINLALGKNTQQSSDVYDAVSNLAVDGKYSAVFYSIGEGGTVTPVCTHTSEEIDRYPWWRVDLGAFFLVKSVNVFNRGEGLHARLHDIEIRIGNADIAVVTERNKLPDEVVGDVLFTYNVLCASIKEDSLWGGKTEITCTQPTIGRYVSIQIIKLCGSIDCQFSQANVKNILTLCEVEVFGQKMDLLLDNVMTTSFDYREEHDDSDEYLWINMDLQEAYIIYSIEIELDNDLFHINTALLEIRVGNEPITSDYNNKYFTQNQLCKSWHKISTHSTIFCKHPVMGRYVTLQLMQCYADKCLEKELILHSIVDLKVWGVHANAYTSTINAASFKPTTQSSVQDSGFPSMAVDRIIPDMNFEGDKCALTLPRNYPWWRVDLKAPYHINYVIIHLPSSNFITVDSEIEVRVGDEDIADHADDSLFNENDVCKVEKTDSWGTKFRCDSFDSGRYVSVQFNNNHLITESLQLCEIEVIGCEM